MTLPNGMVQAIQKALKNGVEKSELAKMYGVTPGTIRNWIKKYNIKDPNARYNQTDVRFKRTPENLAEAQRLLDEGYGFNAIGHKLGVSRTTVREWHLNGYLTKEGRN